MMQLLENVTFIQQEQANILHDRPGLFSNYVTALQLYSYVTCSDLSNTATRGRLVVDQRNGMCIRLTRIA